jgi:hypothetical protein
VFDAAALGAVDTVSGATATTRCIRDAMAAAGPAFAALLRHEGLPPARRFRGPDRGTAALLLLWAGALVLRYRPRVRLRQVYLVAVLAVAGFWLNLQFSQFELRSLLAGRLPAPALRLPFMLLAGVPLAVLFFGNVYCGYVCPFGAAQELVGDLRPARWRIDLRRGAWRYARLLKYGLLFALLVFVVGAADTRAIEPDPLTSLFSGHASGAVWALAGSVLLLSFFFPRFWCRNLCPVGAFLSLLNRVQVLRRWNPSIQPRSCDQGVRRRDELDCLLCDRCRCPGGGRIPFASAARAGTTALFAALVAAVGVYYGVLVWRAHRSAATAPVAGLVGGRLRGGRAVDVERIRQLQREGALSDREALHYVPVGDGADTNASAPASRPRSPPSN